MSKLLSILLIEPLVSTSHHIWTVNLIKGLLRKGHHIHEVSIDHDINVEAHKNVKALWTHGGLLSTQEAIWKGIPSIVMLFFMDQKFNAQMLVAKGVGIYLDIKTLSMQTIIHAIEEIIYNESYTRNMKQLSSEFRDRPIPPLDLAIWSIEYSVRHPNGSLATPLIDLRTGWNKI
ncbi:UDP-glycosyltransferase UGT5-like [Monomorium pharaonis]|uniref:UDP-glycosyltransferase UGT5-like n=1 Tax=Monomorium pharaonis TaxID=307658 RepID=UPI001747105E|nr:UDP-glycosyltransferase UGT5-like [Monomorium pharaonis]